MSLNTPTTQEISDNIIAQLEASLTQTVPALPKSFMRVLSKALAAVFVLLYKYAGFMFLQIFVRKASYGDTEVNGVLVNPLLEWGVLVGVGAPLAATNAELTVTVTVENQTGSLPVNSQLLGPNGVTYITLSSIILNSPTKTVNIRAVADQNGGGGSGAIGNLDPGAVLSFASPLANVADTVTVAAALVTGADGETVESYRSRVLDRFQRVPQGGAYADYAIWGEGVAGIANVYPYTSVCPGQVDLYVEATPESSGDPDGIPTSAQLQAVLDAVELDSDGLATRRPAGALVNAFPITRIAYDITVVGLDVTDVAATQADILEVLTDYFLSREPYILGLSVPPRNDRITRTGIAGAVEDVVSANGGIFNGVLVERGGVTAEDYTLGVGEKAKLSVVTYT